MSKLIMPNTWQRQQILTRIFDLVKPEHNLLHIRGRSGYPGEHTDKISSMISGSCDSIDLKPNTSFWYSTMLSDELSWVSWINQFDDWINFDKNRFISFSINPECYGTLDTPANQRKGKVLKIDNEDSFKLFHNLYTIGPLPVPPRDPDEQKESLLSLRDMVNSRNPSLIDWPRLREQGWQGIEIIPQQYKYRMSRCYQDWYYSWDCACGTIWKPDDIHFDEEVIFSFDQKDSKELVRKVMEMPIPEEEL